MYIAFIPINSYKNVSIKHENALTWICSLDNVMYMRLHGFVVWIMSCTQYHDFISIWRSLYCYFKVLQKPYLKHIRTPSLHSGIIYFSMDFVRDQ